MLHLKNVEVIYDDVILVLKGLSLHVPEGKIVALLGSNGAGKSTTLKAISGLLHTEEGEVTDGVIEFQGQKINGILGLGLDNADGHQRITKAEDVLLVGGSEELPSVPELSALERTSRVGWYGSMRRTFLPSRTGRPRSGGWYIFHL